MKTAIKLLLLYLGFQFIGAFLAMIPVSIYLITRYKSLENLTTLSIAPGLMLSIIFMTIYLWKAGYISTEKRTWSWISAPYLLLTAVIWLASILIIDYIMSFMPWLPNILEQTFDVMQSGWIGILTIAIIGPILEELMFRGAITRVLLKKYNPTKAIIISALIFGIFHINPVQVVTATLIGLLLGWVYYKTASLIPCILIHILNNSMSVYLNLKYPEVENTQDLFTGNTYCIVLIAAIVIFVGAFLLMKRTIVPYPWKESAQEEVQA